MLRGRTQHAQGPNEEAEDFELDDNPAYLIPYPWPMALDRLLELIPSHESPLPRTRRASLDPRHPHPLRLPSSLSYVL